jgi:hypothetical protein
LISPFCIVFIFSTKPHTSAPLNSVKRLDAAAGQAMLGHKNLRTIGRAAYEIVRDRSLVHNCIALLQLDPQVSGGDEALT